MYFPDIATVLATTTAPIASLFTWALPAIGALIALSLGALAIRLVRTKVPGAVRSGLGGGRRRGRGRRR